MEGSGGGRDGKGAGKEEGEEEEGKEKSKYAKEIQSEKSGLTSGERWFLKSFFGYCDTFPAIPGGKLRKASEAPLYVFQKLWPDGRTETTDETDKPFPLQSLIPTEDGVPALFTHSISSISEMFRGGQTMGPLEQTSFLRSMQHFQKLFEPDMAVKPSGYIRLWISGAVS